MKERSSSTGFIFCSVLFSTFLAFILWLMESLTAYFWFSEGSDKGFSAALFPLDDSAELLSRFIIAFTVITMGMVVGIVVQQINSNRRLLHTTLNSIGDGVITVNEAGAVLGMNPVAEDLVGWSFQEAGYRMVSDLFRLVPSDQRDGQCSDIFERIIASRQTIRHSKDIRLIDRSGVEYEVELTVSPMVGPSGKHIGNVIVIRDISELKEMEEKKEKLLEELHQSQKMDAIGQLAGGIAHDFNNVLGGILGSAELIKFEPQLNEQSVRCLEMIANSAMRAGELTRKLLTFSRKSLKSYEPVDLYMIILDTVELIKKSLNKDIVIRLESEVENPVINGNFSFLQNAFLNIGLNAVYAMPEGGVLTISLESVFLDDVYCEASHFNIREGGFAKVSICDTGCGISRENLKRVFEPFFTTKERGVGTGLGLAAVYGTVQDHEGAVTVYSEEGQGTVFHIYLPLISFDKSRVNRNESFHEGSGTILLVDDERYITQTTKVILERIGYSVLVGEDGEQGISLFDEFRDSILLVILDMVMPLTEGGEVYRHIRESNPLLPVVVASGFYRKAESLNAEGDEKMRFLQKPFLPHDLLGTIDELLY